MDEILRLILAVENDTIMLRRNFDNPIIPGMSVFRKRKENPMSIVGIIKCLDGYLGFADRKCSEYTSKGKYQFTKNIVKIYKNDNLIIASSGSYDIGTLSLDDVLKEIINTANNSEEVKCKFLEILDKEKAYNGLHYLLVCEPKGEIVYNFEFRGRNVIVQNNSIGYVNGDLFSKSCLKEFFEKNYPTQEMIFDEEPIFAKKELKDKLIKILNSIYIISEQREYNFISKEIDFIEF